jgi:hypothetical protein
MSDNSKSIQFLSSFQSVSLSELDKVSLQDRMDTKYVFSIDLLPDLLVQLHKAGYKVLEIDGIRAFQYSSMYYDTDDFSLFKRHAAGKLNRYKIRKRNYVNTGTTFFEIKFKNNRGRTIKSRVQLADQDTLLEANKLMKEHTPFNMDGLYEQLLVHYTRITLIAPEFKERVTIDTNLGYVKDGNEWEVEGLVIAELKQNRTSFSLFAKIMKEYHVRSTSLSKYCLGIARLVHTVKKNNFKPQMLLVNKIQNATTTRPRQ